MIVQILQLLVEVFLELFQETVFQYQKQALYFQIQMLQMVKQSQYQE